MTLQLIADAAQLPVLLSEVRDYLKISHPDENALLAGYIRAAAGACERFTGRKLIRQQWRITRNDWGDGVLEIPLSPVLDIAKIEYWSNGAFQEISGNDYLLDQTSWQAVIIPDAGASWPDPEKAVGGIRLYVNAGFGDDQNALPHELRLGLLHWIASVYDHGEPDEAQAVLMAEKLWQPYRRMVL